MPHHYSAIAQTILLAFASRDAEPIDVAPVQPADPFLDVMGEDQRGYFFLTESEIGEPLCLRPEFTIPVSIEYIKRKLAVPRRYAYVGEIFRNRSPSRNAFLQTGLMDLGDPDVATADARSIADAHALLGVMVQSHEFATIIGDQAIFEAVLEALRLPRRWQNRLIRAFGAPIRLKQTLARLAGPLPARNLGDVLEAFLIRGDRETITAYIGDLMARSGFSPNTGRTPEEIATRLIETTELADVRVPQTTFDVVKSFLSIRAPLERAPDEVETFAKAAGLTLGTAFGTFVERSEAIAKLGVPLAQITYDAAFGRTFDHCTGLVFEIYVPGSDSPLVSGGRHDRLLTLLGAERPTPAVAFSALLDRSELSQETMA